MIGLKSKKGDVIMDVVFIIIIVVILGLSAFLIFPTLTELKDDIVTNPSATVEVQDTANTFMDRYPVVMDNMIGISIGLLAVFVMISAWFIDSNPIFFVVSLILTIVLLVATFFISNALFDVTSVDDFASSVTNFPITYWVFNHLAHIVLGMFVLVGVVTYAKRDA